MTVDQFGITELYPTAGGGKEWFSNWHTSSLRYIENDMYDATDADFGILQNGHDNKLKISCGIAQIRQFGETRLFVNGPSWVNTEITIYAKIKDTTTSSIQLRSRANHHGVHLDPYSSDARFVTPQESPQEVSDINSCGFGNYFVRWGQTQPIDFADVGIEIIHELYKLGLDSNPITIDSDEWIGYKQVTRTLASGNVKVEGYNNFNEDMTTWDLATEFEFDGSNATIDSTTLNTWSSFTSYCQTRGDMISGDVNAHQKWPNPGKWSFVRINNPTKVDLKYFSVREIVPF